MECHDIFQLKQWQNSEAKFSLRFLNFYTATVLISIADPSDANFFYYSIC
jgi:hypothetical protein